MIYNSEALFRVALWSNSLLRLTYHFFMPVSSQYLLVLDSNIDFVDLASFLCHQMTFKHLHVDLCWLAISFKTVIFLWINLFEFIFIFYLNIKEYLVAQFLSANDCCWCVTIGLSWLSVIIKVAWCKRLFIELQLLCSISHFQKSWPLTSIENYFFFVILAFGWMQFNAVVAFAISLLLEITQHHSFWLCVFLVRACGAIRKALF